MVFGAARASSPSSAVSASQDSSAALASSAADSHAELSPFLDAMTNRLLLRRGESAYLSIGSCAIISPTSTGRVRGAGQIAAEEALTLAHAATARLR